MCGFIKCSKSKNELEREYLEVEKQDANYGPQIFSLTCNKKSTRNVSLGKEISQVKYG